MINKKKLTKRQFSFKFIGKRDGISYYWVSYRSRISKKIWCAEIGNKLLIEVTKNRKHPKQVYLKELRAEIKSNPNLIYKPRKRGDDVVYLREKGENEPSMPLSILMETVHNLKNNNCGAIASY
jgi:hypothetical protein